MLNVSVSTLAFGAGDGNACLPAVRLKLVSERLTAGEIIAKAVAEQLAALEKLHGQDFSAVHRDLSSHYLSREEVKAQASSGKVDIAAKAALSRQPLRPDIDKEIQRAQRSFQDKCFRIFVDRHELKTLGDTVTLIDGSSITFVRLIPLAGG